MFKTIPSWIKSLDESSEDKNILLEMIKQGKKSIDTPREMNFSIKDLSSTEAAENAVHYIEQHGWKCSIDKDHRGNGMLWIESSMQNYVINKTNLFEDQDFFLRTAMMYKATYDGWYAELL